MTTHKTSSWPHRTGIAVIWLAAALVVWASAAPQLLRQFETVYVKQLNTNGLNINPETGLASIVDLSTLKLIYRSDGLDAPTRSQLELLEDGKPLPPHMLHSLIREGSPGFSHWGDSLYFSSSDRTPPSTNGRRYEIRYRDAGSPFVHASNRHCFSAALALLLLIALFSADGSHHPFSLALKGLGPACILGAALSVSLGLQVFDNRHDFVVCADSDSYTEKPVLSARPPAYYALMAAVSSPETVRAAMSKVARSGKTNELLKGELGNPIVRVVLAQKIILTVALIALFAALCQIVPTALAAAVVLGIGYMGTKPTFLQEWSFTGPIILGAGLVTVAWWRAGLRHALSTILLAAGVAVVARPVANLILERSLVPGQINFVLSETLAMAEHLVVAGALVLCVVNGRARWLAVAAVAASIAFLTRPASIFALVLVVTTAIATRWRPNRPSSLSIAVALLAGFSLLLIPVAQRQLSDRDVPKVSMLHWSLASYALAVAEPSDTLLMADPHVRRFFSEAMAARAAAREKLSPPPGLPYNEEVYRLGHYMYNIVLPISQQIAEEEFPSLNNQQVRERHRLMWALGLPIYRARLPELAGIYWSSYNYMIGPRTRLSALQPLWLTAAALVLLGGLVRSRLAVAGLVVCAGHFLHLVVIALFDQPSDRYVYATEHLLVLGAILVVWAVFEHVVKVQNQKQFICE